MKLGAVTGMQLLVTYKRRPGPEQDALKVRMTFGLITAIACPSITPCVHEGKGGCIRPSANVEMVFCGAKKMTDDATTLGDSSLGAYVSNNVNWSFDFFGQQCMIWCACAPMSARPPWPSRLRDGG